MELNFEKLYGLMPAIVTDRESGRVLMLGFLNKEAWAKSLATGLVTFYSRTRNTLWTKGETSGHTLLIREIRTDCDMDTLEFRVEAQGPGVCHEGYASCFSWKWNEGTWERAENPVFDAGEVYSK